MTVLQPCSHRFILHTVAGQVTGGGRRTCKWLTTVFWRMPYYRSIPIEGWSRGTSKIRTGACLTCWASSDQGSKFASGRGQHAARSISSRFTETAVTPHTYQRKHEANIDLFTWLRKIHFALQFGKRCRLSRFHWKVWVWPFFRTI